MKFFVTFLLLAIQVSWAEKPTFELVTTASSEPIHLHLFADKEESVSLKVKGTAIDQISGRLYQKVGSILAPVQENQVLKIGENRTLELKLTLPELKRPTEFLLVFKPSFPAIQISGYPENWLSSLGKNRKIGLISPPVSLANFLHQLKFSTKIIEKTESFDGDILICFGTSQPLRKNLGKGRTIIVRSPTSDLPETWISKNEQAWHVNVPHHTFDFDQLQSARGHATLARLFFQNPT